MHVCSRLVGLGPLEPMWRPILSPALAEAADPNGVVVDLRSASFRAVGTPTGLAGRTVVVRIVRSGSARSASPHGGKRTRGEIDRYLLEHDAHLEHPSELADLLADRWSVRPAAPRRGGLPWTMEIEAGP